MIGLVDYGVGNISAFINVYESLNIPVMRVSKSSDFSLVEKIILPGVGAFDNAMNCLNESGLREALEEYVLVRQYPILGICVGMQMLASRSDEGILPGLNFIPGFVKSIKSIMTDSVLPIPHMGWNDLRILKASPLFDRSVNQTHSFYFLHSYFFSPTDSNVIVATAEYGDEIPSVISYKNIHGMQCHPEKSHKFGSDFLKAFAEI